MGHTASTYFLAKISRMAKIREPLEALCSRTFEVLVKAEHDFYREKWQKRIKILSRISVSGIFLVSVVCSSSSAVVNGSLDLAARAIVLQAFLFDVAKFVAA